MLGMSPEDAELIGALQVWPENHKSWRLFTVVGGQWRSGAGGPTALDYGFVHTTLERMKVTPEEYDDLFADVRVMEAAALEEIHRKKDE